MGAASKQTDRADIAQGEVVDVGPGRSVKNEELENKKQVNKYIDR